jgi:hypothetical protein
MALNSFSTIKNYIVDVLEESNIGDPVDNWITMAEAEIYRELRIEAMQTAFSDSISSGILAIPADFKGWHSVWLNVDPIQILEPKGLDWILNAYPYRSADSRPQYITSSSRGFEFGPYPDSDYAVVGVYYAKLTALSTSNETNFLTTQHPDLLLYGALQHSAPYLGEDPRLSLWRGAYTSILDSVKREDTKRRFGTTQNLAAVTG